MNIEKFCKKDRQTMREWFGRNLPLIDGKLKGAEPIPPVCKTCYQKMLAELIYEDIKNDTGIISASVVGPNTP